MVMSFKRLDYCKVVSNHLRSNFNASNAILICTIGVKYQYNFRAVCAYERVFRKGPGCVLNGTFTLTGTNTVYYCNTDKLSVHHKVFFTWLPVDNVFFPSSSKTY